MESLVTALEAPQSGSAHYGETPLYPVRQWREKSASFEQSGAPGSKRNKFIAAMADGSLPPLECAVGACVISGNVLMSLLISLRFPRKPPQHRLHMVLNGLLIGLRSALRRLRHPTLLHPAVHARGRPG